MENGSLRQQQELSRMQQDAIRRMQEMQRRAQRAVRGGDPREERPAAPSAPQIPQTPVPPQRRAADPIFSRDLGIRGGGLGRLLETLELDSDRLLILLLLVVLMNEGANTSLVLAMVYLLL